MKKNDFTPFAVLFILFVLGVLYYTQMPRWDSATAQVPLSEFSARRAMSHIKEIAKAPHYVGSAQHQTVADYLEKELRSLGLETTVQQGTTLTDWGNLVHCRNIMARIDGSGSGKALLIMTHYDSAPHSASLGASDAGSGIATLLEGIRAFVHNKTAHRNDIIVLFTDAEELGLNGAGLFVTQHPWAKDVGVALNFEARGTGGPGYMLMEVNQGNAPMVEAFSQANISRPVSNSLMYSIYKMMPNDTDLTVLRTHGKIPGFNFAFIDDHFNYHTKQDDYAHVSPETIAHQGGYLMPMLAYLSNADLSQLDNTDDRVYFSTPIGFFHYPFGWNIPLVIVAAVLLLFFVFIGLGKRTLQPVEIARGSLPLFGAMLICGAVAFLGWKLLRAVYPQYDDILQGFTYNGHAYIAAFILLSLSVCFACYGKLKNEAQIANQSIAPLFLWLLINIALVAVLPGAGFFILPVLFALLMLGYYVITQKINPWVNALLTVPALFLIAPFVVMFPIGLGLKMLAGSAVLTVLLFALLLPFLAMFSRKWLWSAVLFVGFIGCMVYAHLNSGYAPGKARPNSLLYVYDADKEKAYWTTYDTRLDEWTRTYLGDNPTHADHLNHLALFSKYDSKFTYSYAAMVRDIPEPTVDFIKDSIVGRHRFVKIKITPNRAVNRYDVFAAPNMVLHNLRANGARDLKQKGSLFPRHGRKILSYYVVGNGALTLEFMMPKSTPLDMHLLESSFDLMQNKAFGMQPRKDWMMPTPFVLNDAVALIKKIEPTPKVTIAVPVPKNFSYQSTTTLDTIPDPDAMPESENIP